MGPNIDENLSLQVIHLKLQMLDVDISSDLISRSSGCPYHSSNCFRYEVLVFPS